MIVLEKGKGKALYLQLYIQLQQEILDGILAEGTILPGSRQLANTLQISRNTVDNAYGMLAAEGYIVAKRGIGYKVAKIPKLPKINLSPNHLEEKQENIKNDTAGIDINADNKNIVYDLTNSSHTSDLFPKNLWRKYTLSALERLDKEASLSIFLNKQGEFYLRHNLRNYLERIRGVHCGEDQLIITSGLQQSLDILCKILGHKKKRFLMEEPGYNKAVAVFKNNGLIIECVSVDKDGLQTSCLPDNRDIGAVYCTPSHQFPTGSVLTISRRRELLQWAHEQEAFIIEDDYDSELQYYAKPIPALQSMDCDDRVIYLGTFSKGLSPSVRMGYMILPKQLLEKYHQVFANYNSTVPLLNQYVIASLIAEGQYDRHIRRLSNVFRKRMTCFCKELSKSLNSVKVVGNSRAQYCLLKFPDTLKQDELIKAAEDEGVRVYSTMQFWQEKAECLPNTLFMGLCKINVDDIPDCVARLHRAWQDKLKV